MARYSQISIMKGMVIFHHHIPLIIDPRSNDIQINYQMDMDITETIWITLKKKLIRIYLIHEIHHLKKNSGGQFH